MKKLFTLTFCALSVVGCKTQVEKDISLKSLLNDPIKTETALLNVEVSSCGDREDSRKPSESLLKMQEIIPSVFPQAKYKECFSKKFDSFASFEIPIGVGVVDDNTKLENGINIYRYNNRLLNVNVTKDLSNNIKQTLKKNHESKLDLEILINLKNDTGEEQAFNAYSLYWNDAPISVGYPVLKNNETAQIRLSNASSDALWVYKDGARSTVLSTRFDIDKLNNQ